MIRVITISQYFESRLSKWYQYLFSSIRFNFRGKNRNIHDIQIDTDCATTISVNENDDRLTN